MALCAGIGGLELGLGLAVPGYRTVAYVEREAPSAALLVAAMQNGILDAAPVWDDLATFDGRCWRGTVDLISAGYPCQPFSVAGKRKGADDPRHLWPHIRRVVEEVEPVQVFLENVGGHLRLGFREVAADLRAMGYEVAAGLFTAEEVGAPHQRERLFILANDSSWCSWRTRERRSASDDYGEMECQNNRSDGRNATTARLGIPNRSSFVSSAEREGNTCCLREFPESGPDRGPDHGDSSRSAMRRRHGSEKTESQSPMAQSPSREMGTAGLARQGASVADAAVTRRSPTRPRTGQHAGGEPEAGCGAVEHANVAGRQGRQQPEREGSDELAAWPPSPAERDRWADIDPRLWPARPAESAVRGVADGTPSRIDLLRALGNGVVPAVAAHAYRTLAEVIKAMQE